MPGQPFDGVGVEQRRRVLPGHGQPSSGRVADDRQVELGPAALVRQQGDVQAVQLRSAVRARLEGEHRLEDRVLSEHAGGVHRIDDLLERHVLVAVGLGGEIADPGEQVVERGVIRRVDPQRKHGDEQPDHVGKLVVMPTAGRAAYDEIALAAVPLEQRSERREQDHECRGVVVSGVLLYLPQQVRVQQPAVLGTCEAGPGRSRPVGRDGGLIRCAGQGRAPPLQIRLRLGAPLLPGREVGIVERDLRQVRRALVTVRGVQLVQLATEDLLGHRVRRDVVGRQHEDVVVGGEEADAGPQQAPLAEIERLGDGPLDERVDIGDRRDLDVTGGRLTDFDVPLAVAQGVPAAQHLVAGDERVQRGNQRSQVERPTDPHGLGDVVGVEILGGCVEQQQRELSGRDTRRGAARPTPDRLRAGPGPQPLLDEASFFR